MELAVIFFITVMGLGNEINQNNERIAELETRTMLQQKWIEDLEYWNEDQDMMNEAQDETMESHYSMALKLAEHIQLFMLASN